MRFEDLAVTSGRAAAEIGRRSNRPSFPRILERRHRRALTLGWSSAVAVFAIVAIGAVMLWPGPRSSFTPVVTATTGSVAATGIDDCPLTVSQEGSFAPASAAPQMSPPDPRAVWLGTPRIWTSIHPEGEIWSGLPVAADGSFTQKTFWWSDDIVSISDPVPDIAFTAQSLDESGAMLPAQQVTLGGNPEQGVFAIARFQIPEAGCWRITAEYRNTALSYVAWLQGEDPSPQTFALLDGSEAVITDAPDLTLAGYLFTLDVEGVGPSNVDLSPGLDPADPATVDETAVLESNPGQGVMLWRAERDGEPLFLTVDLGGWVAVANVGYEIAPSDENLLAIAEKLEGSTGARGVILSNYTPEWFTTYLEEPDSDNRIDLLANQCVMDMVPGVEAIEDPRLGDIVRGPGYASWCHEAADIALKVHGDEEFVDRIVAELALSRIGAGPSP